jgi:predicted CXXCH cytochrome family protein
MPYKAVILLLWVFLGFGALGTLDSGAVRAVEPPPDLQCRGCHGNNARELTLPSGESLPLRVDLAALNASPHSSTHAAAVSCQGCHGGRDRYLYPHAANPAQSLHEFAAEVAESCQNCHYAHTPFHDVEQTDYAVPNCVACHGSHQIDRVDTMLESMPANCLACHTGEERAWAESFVAPRPGIGEGAEGYAGSTRCVGCHEDLYFSWRETYHANLIQDAQAKPDAVLADFTLEDPNRTFGYTDVVYTIGSLWKQVYMTETVEGKLELLPAQWTVATGEWNSYHPQAGQSMEWLPSCGSCHVTGLNTTTWGFTEFNVGCESCHGPAAAHAADPQNVKPFAKADDQVCGACHSRGTSPEGHAFPATYRPGDTLADHFTLTGESEFVWPDGSAKGNHQQYMDWKLGSSMSLAANMGCTTCHAVHDQGVAGRQLRAPLNNLCLSCHDGQKALVRHTPFHEKAITKYEFTCADCHMPKMASSATAFDLRVHSFLQPNPQGSIDHGGLEMMPNACNRCHEGLGEEPEWAAQTIAYAKSLATPSAAAFFGPGPTPTSPPPPTPIASVGQRIERAPVESGGWLRTTVLGLMGLVGLGILVYTIRLVRLRRLRHV